MWVIPLLPFFLQALCIAFDEGYFHYKRGLPKWERIGHPLDTLTVLLCLGWTVFAPFSSLNLKIYIALGAFSCLFVTKDEFVHKEHCPAAESWLHAVLFTLHPLTLALAGMIWYCINAQHPPLWLIPWFKAPFSLRLFLQGQLSLMTLFLIYQIVLWNVIWKGKKIPTNP
jgi:hypothetical protein